MSDNTDKLLRALIDAIGLEITEDRDFGECEENESGRDRIMSTPFPGGDRRMIYGENGLVRGSRGMYRSRLIEPIITYKVIPKIDVREV